ncbi:MAG: hypothetical protein RMJ44_02660 [Cytophagales bacterium]|nr:hypothetical protein [Bernardetiaceae bacterium]MDW8209964.1 hypothetical protein [Cytophagales bacterium]
MNTIFQNHSLLMSIDPTQRLMITVWTTKPTLQDEEYKELMYSFLNAILQYRPERILIDSRKAEYVIRPDMQDWINANIYPPAAEAGVRKAAFLLGEDLFMQLSLEQVVEDSMQNEKVRQIIQQNFFHNYDEAIQWLQA